MAKVILIKPHEHEGVAHPAGATLEVPMREAAWIIGRGVGKSVEAPPHSRRRSQQTTVDVPTETVGTINQALTENKSGDEHD